MRICTCKVRLVILRIDAIIYLNNATRNYSNYLLLEIFKCEVGVTYITTITTGGSHKWAESKLYRFDPKPDLDNANVGTYAEFVYIAMPFGVAFFATAPCGRMWHTTFFFILHSNHTKGACL